MGPIKPAYKRLCVIGTALSEGSNYIIIITIYSVLVEMRLWVVLHPIRDLNAVANNLSPL